MHAYCTCGEGWEKEEEEEDEGRSWESYYPGRHGLILPPLCVCVGMGVGVGLC